MTGKPVGQTFLSAEEWTFLSANNWQDGNPAPHRGGFPWQ